MRTIFDPSRQRVPIRIWSRAPPKDALRQLERIAAAPWAEEAVLGMADLHVAEGVAVGTVFATARTLVPSALGGDLGCGMAAHRLVLPSDGHADALARPDLERIVAALDRAIPSGDACHRGAGVVIPDALALAALSTGALRHDGAAIAARHLGTLGGGNHFVELDRDADGGLWLLVHSGSRGLGASIAAHHLRAAAAVDPGALPTLDAESDGGRAYARDLSIALEFARENRRALAGRAVAIVREVLGIEVVADELVDVHHNYVAFEDHGGRPLWVHRKGAVRASAGALALIPGSMGTASYLVEGLGAEASFASCSHGAGRVLRRSEARARIDPRAFTRSMRDVVFPKGRARALVEEAPAAYRDIGEVLEDQRELVRRRVRLEPIAVLKG